MDTQRGTRKERSGACPVFRPLGQGRRNVPVTNSDGQRGKIRGRGRSRPGLLPGIGLAPGLSDPGAKGDQTSHFPSARSLSTMAAASFFSST